MAPRQSLVLLKPLIDLLDKVPAVHEDKASDAPFIDQLYSCFSSKPFKMNSKITIPEVAALIQLQPGFEKHSLKEL